MLTFGSGEASESMFFDHTSDSFRELSGLLEKLAIDFPHRDDDLCAPFVFRLASLYVDSHFFLTPRPGRELVSACPHRISAAFSSGVVL